MNMMWQRVARSTPEISVSIASIDVEENTWMGQKFTRFVEKMKRFSSMITVDDDEGFEQFEAPLQVLERKRGLRLGRQLPAT